MKKIYIFIVSMLFVFGVKGQHWTGLLQTENPTFFETQDAFNQYWEPYNVVNGKYIENGAEKKAHGWKQFKRWEWFWEPRVDEDGLFPASDVNLTEWQNYLDANPEVLNNTSSNWTYWGASFTSPSEPSIGVGRLNCIAFHPTNANIFWVGSPAGGLWKTIDGGSSWSTTTDNLPVMGVSDIAIDHTNTNIIYIATGDGDNGSITGDTKSMGVYKSIDGGNTFNQTDLNWSVTEEKTIRRLLIDPVNPQVLIAATSDGIWRTGNGGATFTEVESGPFKDIEFKPFNSSYVYGTTYYDGSNPNTKIFRSINNGVTWSQVASFPSGEVIRSNIAVSQAQPDLLDIVTVNTSRGFHGLYYSTNSGASGTFYNNSAGASYTYNSNGDCTAATGNLLGARYDATSCAGQGNYDLAFATNPNDPNEMWLGGVNTWKSTDGGTNWSLMTMGNSCPDPLSWCYNPNNVLVQHADKHFFAFHPITNDIYECNDGGLFVSSDGGVSWTNKSDGLGIGQIYRIGGLSSISNHVITGLQDNGTKELFNNLWYESPPGGDGMECIIDPTNGNIQYAAVQYGTIYKTTDGWTTKNIIVNSNLLPISAIGINQKSAWVTPYLMHPNNSNTLIVGKRQVYQTTNGGANWSPISGNFSSVIKSMAYAPSNPQVIYVATDSDFYTNNGVNNWQFSTSSNNSDKITYIAVDPNNAQRVFITKSGYSSNNKVWESNDGGATWTNISGTSLPNVPANCITYQHGSNDGLYVGTDLGVYYKDATMNNWIPLNNGLPNVIVNELEISYVNNKLWAGTFGRGLWECDIVVSGCTDPLACNYNPQANINDNSCSYMSVNTSSTNVTCYGGTNGTANAWISGGIGPYTWLWSNGQTSSSATNLSAGLYSCTVTDSNGCSISGNINVTEPSALIVTTSSTDVSCFGGANGTANAGISGGVGPYTWLWSNAQTSSPATNLSAGSYSCTVTDLNGCQSSVSIFLSQPTPLFFSASYSYFNGFGVSCYAATDGEIEIFSPSGGTPNYTYSINGGGTYSSLMTYTGLGSGAYVVISKDANDCISPSTTINLTSPPILNGSIVQSTIDLQAIANGGVPTYNYLWNTNQTTQTLTPQSNGIYWCTITDANNCVTNKIYRTVNNIPSAIAELEISNLSIYPNPNYGYFTIEFSSLITQDLKVKITNAIGEIVSVDNTENYIGEYKKQINLKDYSKGTYFLEIETYKGITNYKIILN